MNKRENTYQLIKEFTHRDLDGVDHFRYFVEKNGSYLGHTICDNWKTAKKWYDSLISPNKPLPSNITILETDIIEEEISLQPEALEGKALDAKLSSMMGFDVNDLDDILDTKPKKNSK
jgi:hypothetical protein